MRLIVAALDWRSRCGSAGSLDHAPINTSQALSSHRMRALIASRLAAVGALAACAGGAASRANPTQATAAPAEATPEASPAKVPSSLCPAGWLALPSDDPFTIDGGTVILHASAAGTQDYECKAVLAEGARYAWTFRGPGAELRDCNGAIVAKHFASDAGAGFPEWRTHDGTGVVGQKVSTYTPVGGGGSIPWLLLSAQAPAGVDGGSLRLTRYIERLHTDGGNAPSVASCSSGNRDVTQKVPYTADYYFLAP
jgi:uncharacterized protein DUF3455